MLDFILNIKFLDEEEMFLRKVLVDHENNTRLNVRFFSNKMFVMMFCFSISYAAFEYYLITDPSYGSRPILSSLIYPYHLLMAAIFGSAAFSFVVLCLPSMKYRLLTLILVVAIFSVMLVIEDFAWFTFRAIAPLSEDVNAGKLVTEGEWTTQFMGSTSFYFTAVPNWYFLSTFYAVVALMTVRAIRKKDDLRLGVQIQ